MSKIKSNYEIISDKENNVPVTTTPYIQHDGKWLDEVLDEIKKDYVTPQMFGAVGDGVHDDTEAVKAAITRAGTINFPIGTYKVTEEIAIPEYKRFIGANKYETVIKYYPKKSGNFITATYEHNATISIENMTIECDDTDYDVNGIVIALGGVDNPKWGGRPELRNVFIKKFTLSQVLVYGPYRSVFENVTFNGTGFTRRTDNPNLCNGKSIGLSLIGYELNKINTFGNENIIRDCVFTFNKYGLFITSSVGNEVTNSTFEPNFINIYAPDVKGSAGDRTRLSVSNSWFEDYTNQSHPLFGAYCTKEINESTGDTKENATKSSLYFSNNSIHAGSQHLRDDMFVANGYEISTYFGGYSTVSNIDFKKCSCVDGDVFKISGGEIYSYPKISSRGGYRNYKHNNNFSQIGYDEDYNSYLAVNPNTDKNEAFTYTIPNLKIGYTSTNEIEINIYILSNANVFAWYKVVYGGNNLVESKIMNDEANIFRTIEDGVRGVKPVVNDSRYIELTIKGAGILKARIDVKVKSIFGGIEG